MRLLFVMSVIFQNGIIAVPNQPPEILEQLKELQQHIKRLETDGRKLMDENENFKRQIDGLLTSKVVLYADMEDKIASQNDKIVSFSKFLFPKIHGAAALECYKNNLTNQTS